MELREGGEMLTDNCLLTQDTADLFSDQSSDCITAFFNGSYLNTE